MATRDQHAALHQLSAAGRRAVQERGARAPQRSLGDWLRERRRKGAAVSGVSFDELMTDVADQRDEGSAPRQRG